MYCPAKMEFFHVLAHCVMNNNTYSKEKNKRQILILYITSYFRVGLMILEVKKLEINCGKSEYRKLNFDIFIITYY